MIFLREHNILFLKPRKVAGTSFEIALSKFAGPTDIITTISPDDEKTRAALGLRGAQNYRSSPKELAKPRVLAKSAARLRMPVRYWNHMPATAVRKALGPETFDAAFKVSIVRDPFDVLVSLYYWNNRKGSDAPAFETWVRSHPQDINSNDEQYLIDGVSVVDHMIRYEDLTGTIEALERERPALRGLTEAFASVRAKGGIRPAKATRNAMFEGRADLVAAVRFFNEDICERYGYR